jgi:hypothetical protein
VRRSAQTGIAASDKRIRAAMPCTLLDFVDLVQREGIEVVVLFEGGHLVAEYWRPDETAPAEPAEGESEP